MHWWIFSFGIWWIKLCQTLNYNSNNLIELYLYTCIYSIILGVDVGYWGREHRFKLDRVHSLGYLFLYLVTYLFGLYCVKGSRFCLSATSWHCTELSALTVTIPSNDIYLLFLIFMPKKTASNFIQIWVCEGSFPILVRDQAYSISIN